MAKTRYYQQKIPKPQLNLWDFVALVIILATFSALAWGAMQMATPYQLGNQPNISLDPLCLPEYALRTVLRMFLAFLLSLLFTLTIGTWAAKNQRAEQIIIPMIDVLQSVPVLSFLSITVVGFITLFPGSLLGPEMASIFAIFTAQAWNMALGFYQSIRTVPHHLSEAANMFHLSAWQRFWRIEVPFSMPSLLWNTMMSLSASWFFVVASEAISVANQNIMLPGIGSYIAKAIEGSNLLAVGYAIVTMLVVILLYDQLIFRPLIKWSEKFNPSDAPNDSPTRSWVLELLQKTHLTHWVAPLFHRLSDNFINFKWFNFSPSTGHTHSRPFGNWLEHLMYYAALGLSLWGVVYLVTFILSFLDWPEILSVTLLGAITCLRVLILILLASLIWIPVGVFVGRRPRLTQTIQPIAQFLASFPANLLFPLVVVLILRYQLNVDIWATPLMILGSQWYILFNVIAGTATVPKELFLVADNLQVKGWLRWTKLVLPGIFPYYITGAITAAGGAWNASIVAEWISWGETTLMAKGLGAYIAQHTTTGDFPRIALGTGMMCVFVLLLNQLLWKPLYHFAQRRFH